MPSHSSEIDFFQKIKGAAKGVLTDADARGSSDSSECIAIDWRDTAMAVSCLGYQIEAFESRLT